MKLFYMLRRFTHEQLSQRQQQLMDAVLGCQKYKLPHVNWMRVICALDEPNRIKLSIGMRQNNLNNFFYDPDIYSLGYIGNFSCINTFLSHYYNIRTRLKYDSPSSVSFSVSTAFATQYLTSAKYLSKYSYWFQPMNFDLGLIVCQRLLSCGVTDLTNLAIPQSELANHVYDYLVQKYTDTNILYQQFKTLLSHDLQQLILKHTNFTSVIITSYTTVVTSVNTGDSTSNTNITTLPLDIVYWYIKHGTSEEYFNTIYLNTVDKQQFELLVNSSNNNKLQTWFCNRNNKNLDSHDKVIISSERLLSISKIFNVDELPLVMRVSISNNSGNCEIHKSQYQQWLTSITNIITI